MSKINLGVIRPWITKRVTELLGFEDEIVISYINSLLESQKVGKPLISSWSLSIQEDFSQFILIQIQSYRRS